MINHCAHTVLNRSLQDTSSVAGERRLISGEMEVGILFRYIRDDKKRSFSLGRWRRRRRRKGCPLEGEGCGSVMSFLEGTFQRKLQNTAFAEECKLPVCFAQVSKGEINTIMIMLGNSHSSSFPPPQKGKLINFLHLLGFQFRNFSPFLPLPRSNLLSPGQ